MSGIDWDLVGSVALASLSAMARILIISIVGYVSALYPKNQPFLDVLARNRLSRINTYICMPCTILYILGVGLTPAIFDKVLIMVVFALCTFTGSYIIGYVLGGFLIEDDKILYQAVVVAIGTPNSVSFPMMIMESMCQQSSLVQGDYEDAEECYVEAIATLFVYSIGWYIVFWGYGFPTLQSLGDMKPTGEEEKEEPLSQGAEKGEKDENEGDYEKVKDSDDSNDEKKVENSTEALVTIGDGKQEGDVKGGEEGESSDSERLSALEYVKAKHAVFLSFISQYTVLLILYRILTSPMVICTFIGIAIGTVRPIQNALFIDFTPATPLGASMFTLSQPMVAVNCLIMSSSLASISIFPPKDEEDEKGKEGEEKEEGEEGEEKEGEERSGSGNSDDKKKGDVSAPFGKDGSLSLYTADPNVEPYMRVRSMSLSDIDGWRDRGDMNRYRKSQGGYTDNGASLILDLQFQQDGSREEALLAKRGGHSSHSSRVNKEKKRHVPPPLPQTVFAMVTLRLVIPPLIMVFIVKALMDYQVFGAKHRTMMLLAVIEAGSPSAQFMLVALNQLGLPEVAGKMSYMYIFQYSSAIITITIWTIVACTVIY